MMFIKSISRTSSTFQSINPQISTTNWCSHYTFFFSERRITVSHARNFKFSDDDLEIDTKPPITHQNTSKPPTSKSQKQNLSSVLKKLEFSLVWELIRHFQPYGFLPETLLTQTSTLENLSKASNLNDIYELIFQLSQRTSVLRRLTQSQQKELTSLNYKLSSSSSRPLSALLRNDSLDYYYSAHLISNSNSPSLNNYNSSDDKLQLQPPPPPSSSSPPSINHISSPSTQISQPNFNFEDDILIIDPQSDNSPSSPSSSSQQSSSSSYQIVLNEVEVKSSCRFWRKYSSDRFITLKVDKEINQNTLKDLCLKGIKLHPTSRLYRFLYSKPLHNEIIFFCTNMSPKLSSHQIRQWHCDIHLNPRLSICKYNARIALGFSDSKPVLHIPVACSKIVSDVIHWKSRHLLTDGCSFISSSFLEKIKDQLGLAFTPSVIQARYGSAKGVWIRGDEYMQEPKDMIYIRRSQSKYYLTPSDEYQETLELLHYAKDTGPAALNRQYIQVLEHLGVSCSVFLQLLDESMKLLIQSLISTPDLTLHTLNYGKGTSGMEKEICQLLLAGFGFEEPFLRSKITSLIKSKLQKLKEKSNITVRKSRYLMMIPDPSNSLQPNEVFLQISGRFSPPSHHLPGGYKEEVIQGEVIATRTPCHLPSDIQKFVAVDKKELHAYYDCIVFSTQTSIAPASLLSGGDYDGDLAWVCWDDRITRSVRISSSVPRMEDIEDDSAVKKDPLSETMVLPAGNNVNNLEKLMVEHSLQQIFHNKLGELTIFHAKLSELKGLNNYSTLRLAKLCCLAVDAAKSGHIVSIPPEIASLPLPTPHYLQTSPNQSGKRSIRALGRIFDTLADTDSLIHNYMPSWWLDYSKSSPNNALILDQDLVLSDIPQEIQDLAEEFCNVFQQKLRVFPKDDKTQQFIAVYAELRRIFFSPERDDKELLQLSSAIYRLVREKDINAKCAARSVSWNVCFSYLTRIKSLAVKLKRNIY